MWPCAIPSCCSPTKLEPKKCRVCKEIIFLAVGIVKLLKAYGSDARLKYLGFKYCIKMFEEFMLLNILVSNLSQTGQQSSISHILHINLEQRLETMQGPTGLCKSDVPPVQG